MPPPVHPGLKRRIAVFLRRDVHDGEDDEVRVVVRLRARDACAYCVLSTTGAFNVEHIIPPGKWADYVPGDLRGMPHRPGRGAPNPIDNYAWACPHCS